MKYFTIYEVTNLVNGRTYIGKHETNDPYDDYMGSGKLLKRAIIKYGIECFDKTVLFVFDNEADMNVKEKDLVTEQFCYLKSNYNLCPGGNGGFGYINNTMTEHRTKAANSTNTTYKHLKSTWGKSSPTKGQAHPNFINSCGFKDRNHSEEWKINHSEFMRENQKGSKNSQYGTCWITNGEKNKKIKSTDLDQWLEKGYKKGRITAKASPLRT